MNSAATPPQIRGYYDADAARSVGDYAFGNARVEAALRHVADWLPGAAPRVLDIGCGAGWSAWQIKQMRPEAAVRGVDLSPRRIELARMLFSAPGLEFAAGNILEMDTGGGFDAIVMIDVYEHIQRGERAAFHRILKEALRADSAVILTCPSVSYQGFLRQHQPQGLQPVDEDVSADDLAVLARDLGGRVAFHRHKSIWRKDDYFHAVIERGARRRPRTPGPLHLELPSVRYERVLARTGRRPSRAGVLLPNDAGPNVCVIQPNAAAYSETFIRQHLERLPARVRMLYGGWFPLWLDDGSRLLPFPVHALQRLKPHLPAALPSVHAPLRDIALAAFLKRRRIDAVLAEYGLVGAAVADSCVRAGVPFVVHFFGFDAYAGSTVKANLPAYRRMFEAASGIVAVSRHMQARLAELGAPASKIHCIPCGADTDLFAGGNPAQAPPHFVAVARFVGKKGPHLTLQAFAKVVRRVPAARLSMIGDGKLLESSKALAASLGLGDTVEFAGVRRPAEVAAVFRRARAFVQHSVTSADGDAEGTPVAILEAGASGLPVVATRHGGITDVVLDGETGFLVDEGDVESMARSMVRLAEDAGLAASLGGRARQRVSESFSLDRTIGELWAVIQNAVAGKGR